MKIVFAGVKKRILKTDRGKMDNKAIVSSFFVANTACRALYLFAV